MKNITFVVSIILLVICSKANAQIEFEKGFYIDQFADTIVCYVKNFGWSSTPDNFTVKSLDNQTVYSIDADEIKSIQIGDRIKFVNRIVQEDISDNNQQRIAIKRKVEFNQNQRILKVLIESKFSLYMIEEGEYKDYFYSEDNGVIKQLVNKKFAVTGNGFAKSNEYLKQLLRINTCETEKLNSFVKNMRLSENNLISYFLQINQCSSSKIKRYEELRPEGKTVANFSFKAGVNTAKSRYIFASPNSAKEIEVPRNTSYTLGLEVEIPLKVNQYKWSVIFEPTYKQLASSTTVVDQGLDREYEYQIYSIDIPLGIRYKMYLKENLNLFLNFKVQHTFHVGNSYVDLDFGQDHSAQTRFNFSYGAGIKWKKFSLEYRRDSQDILFQRVYEQFMNYNNAMVIGYNFR
ncbi:Outer membrane protein beta-barrel domain-containing protein [Marivirga sericea]|uniref:Outer membrane protein beta-barrel domain-containing protein n=1 Tax=Marivirga sericea TaxID=1028 RepID=A0A1X7JK77_9BACT|nr:outer membrane beta-barrel protein [Marivirga sericea]SMG27734.1 Outer membrane protein beta-barrel domain-containing protein [Marivirga sericea]